MAKAATSETPSENIGQVLTQILSGSLFFTAEESGEEADVDAAANDSPNMFFQEDDELYAGEEHSQKNSGTCIGSDSIITTATTTTT